ncbi:ABC transporter permease [Wenyingzhuangia marina]|uniref:ABC-2 type transport system permease protein n=1 Tax=Wenyingzhuangia marina TaxID=1195760 RepID=A0A1M5TZ11_9FLAO|nr:ABC transporter permease [Wenyingzhuangia marina]GGF70329.1 ABC transporter permease [Wenyingzhuangia marina]SHH56065.1 ABC-2 type transport system permease protein [Wenyingzhuangia marina]
MHKLLLIIQREFITKVRSKAYLVLIFLSPILMIGMFAAIFYFASKENKENYKQVSILAVTTPEIAADIQKENQNITVEYRTVISFKAAKKLVNDQDLNGLVYANPLSNMMEIYGDDKIPLHSLETILEKHWVLQQLKNKGVKEAVIKQATENTPIHYSKKDDSHATIQKWVKGTVAIGSGYLIMMFVIIYGNSVMRSIIEEKNSRVVEIMVCTVKPFQLMLGKIIGNALAGILQFLIWGILLLGGLFLLQIYFPSVGGNSDKIEQIFNIIWEINYTEIFVGFVFFFLSGYLLYSSFYAAVGAAVSSETDTQQFVHPILLPLMFAVYIGIVTVINGNPNGSTALLFSFVPFTSPVVMLMRIPFGVPMWQIILSLALLLVSFITTVYVASKIYRIGILTYGNKPSMKQLVKWMFQK